ncbi:hypothetical protein FB451DRAFT_1306294, partial [Mycena latifolia]
MSFFTPFYLSFWAGTGTLLYAFFQKNENLLYNLVNKRALYLSFSIPFFAILSPGLHFLLRWTWRAFRQLSGLLRPPAQNPFWRGML